MKLFKICKNELKSFFDKKMKIVALIAVIAIPLLYSFLYLKAYWDPYGSLKNYKIAIVNSDKGATLDDKNKNYGNDMVKDLKKNHDVGFKFVNKSTAEDGINSDKYFAAIEIPSDFSEKIVDAKDGHAVAPELKYISNNKKNYIGTKISESVKDKILKSVRKSVSKEYGKTAFKTVYELRDGLKDASSATKKLASGTTKLKDGTEALVDGTNDLNDGGKRLEKGLNTLDSNVPKLYSGVDKLYKGSKDLKAGLGSLKSKLPSLTEGADKLTKGSGSLAKGTDQLDASVSQLTVGINKLYEGYEKKLLPSVEQLHAGSTKLQQGLSGISSNADKFGQYAKGLTDGSDKINQNTAALEGAIKQSSDGMTAVGTYLQAAAKTNPDVAKDPNVQKALQVLQQMQQSSAGQQDKIKEFTSGLDQYSKSASEFAAGAGQLSAGLGDAIKGSKDLDDGMNTLETAMKDENSGSFRNGLSTLNKNMPALQKGSSSLKSGAKALNDGLKQINGNMPSLVDGVGQLYDGSGKESVGLSQLNNQVPALGTGIKKLVDGSYQLVDGSKQLLDGSNKLNTNMNKLKNGETKLRKSLIKGVNKVNDNVKTPSSELGSFIGNPVHVKDTNINPVNNYGSGLAPYFLPISLWIGAVIMLLVLKVKTSEYKDMSNFQLTIGKYIPYAVIGIIQAVSLGLIVLSLGIKPSNTLLLFSFLIVSALAFDAIIFNFINLFGIAGEAIAIVLLVLQLCSDAGTFPVETLPKFFRAVSPFLPFTYTVQGIREILFAANINMSLVARDMLITVVFGIISLGISVVFIKKGEKINQLIEESLAA